MEAPKARSSARSTVSSAQGGRIRPSPMGIGSMKRTATGCSRASVASASQSSACPAAETQLSFRFRPGASSAASRPRNTSGSRSRRVSAAKRSRSSVSRLRLSPSSPAPSSAGRFSASATPLVVSVTRLASGMALIPAISVGRPFRASGSPPVIRKLTTPRDAKIPQRRKISSKRRMVSCFVHLIPSPGIQ